MAGNNTHNGYAGPARNAILREHNGEMMTTDKWLKVFHPYEEFEVHNPRVIGSPVDYNGLNLDLFNREEINNWSWGAPGVPAVRPR